MMELCRNKCTVHKMTNRVYLLNLLLEMYRASCVTLRNGEIMMMMMMDVSAQPGPASNSQYSAIYWFVLINVAVIDGLFSILS